MNEQEWLASADPIAMLAHIKDKVSARRLRLFACACVRLVWGRLDDRSREAVGCAEAWADGATSDDRERAELAASTHTGCLIDDVADAARQALRLSAIRGATPAAQAALLRDICGNLFRPVRPPRLCACGNGRPSGLRRDDGTALCECGRECRCPWLTPTVLALARAAYDHGREVPCGRCGGERTRRVKKRLGSLIEGVRVDFEEPCPDCAGTGRTSDGLLDPDRLLILADVLEEAGCDNEDVLRHLRDWERCTGCDGSGWSEWDAPDAPPPRPPCQCRLAGAPGWRRLRGPHCRGCWTVDLILNKS